MCLQRKLHNLASFQIEVQLPIMPGKYAPYCKLPRQGTIPFR